MQALLSLRKFTIRFRMLAAIVMVILLFAALGGTGLLGMKSIASASSQFIEGPFGESVHLAKLYRYMGDARRTEKAIIISFDSEKQVAAGTAEWKAAMKSLLAEVDALKSTARSPEAAEAVAKVEKQLLSYQTRFERTIGSLSGFDSPNAAQRGSIKAHSEAQEAQALIATLQDQLGAEADAARQAVDASAQQTLAVFAGVLALALLVVVPLTLANSRSIVKPIEEAQKAAERIATGNLSGDIAVAGQDEISRMVEALARMQASLGRTVSEVRHSAENIQVASSEVASGNADLSHRTEQTASNLQQAASSMEQLTGTVKQSADAARTAHQLASSSAEVAQRGGQLVSQVVATMNEIDASSRRIADIIATIDGIAFQTNILALNAAVEAARAGEQGRGFAVVAGEVRSLAQRSAEAAREIKTLIGNSVDKVETGSRLVADAGNTMTEIVASVQRVSDIIGEISAAAAEQSTGIGQVNASVVRLDQMTQQNAALVEESAAAAESMKEQAQKLASVVSAFQLGQASAAQPEAPPAARAAAAPPAQKKLDPPVQVVKLPASAAVPTTAQRAAREVVQRASQASRQPAMSSVPPAPPSPSVPPVPPKSAGAGDGDWETF